MEDAEEEDELEEVDERDDATEQQEAGRGAGLMWASDIEGEAWDEDEVRLRIVPVRAAGLRRQLGVTRGEFTQRVEQRRRHKTSPRDKKQQQRQLQTASTTTIVQHLIRELREL